MRISPVILDYDGRCFWMPNGWSLRFRIERTATTPARPAGIKYAFTLHGEDGERILGFDNAAKLPRRTAFDHRHPFRRVSEHVPYDYVDADRLICDFFNTVEQACRAENVPFVFEWVESRSDPDAITD